MPHRLVLDADPSIFGHATPQLHHVVRQHLHILVAYGRSDADRCSCVVWDTRLLIQPSLDGG